jgi:hypothetical protein
VRGVLSACLRGRALEVDTSRLGRERLVIVPGLTVSVQQMLDATRSYADVDALVSHVPRYNSNAARQPRHGFQAVSRMADALQKAVRRTIRRSFCPCCSEVVAAIVQSWPAELDSPLSRALGFTTDHDIDSIIDQYRRGHLAPKT